jgi:hypothetical protein
MACISRSPAEVGETLRGACEQPDLQALLQRADGLAQGGPCPERRGGAGAAFACDDEGQQR